MWPYMGWGLMGWWMVLWWAAGIVILVLLVRLVAGAAGGFSSRADETPEQILKRRYAKARSSATTTSSAWKTCAGERRTRSVLHVIGRRRGRTSRLNGDAATESLRRH